MLQINLLPLRDPTGVEQPFTTRDFLPYGRTTNPMESNEVHITYTFVDESGSIKAARSAAQKYRLHATE